ncbi:MAG: septum formation protein Maf [Anaerolineae bacterium]|nr:septum formation protein Maf [Anaerolineae bacterium]
MVGIGSGRACVADRRSERGDTLEIVLASASPRRRELLGTLGLNFRVQPGWVDETPEDGELPTDLARRLAMEKAVASYRVSRAPLVIAADTLVVLDGEIMGKPVDPDEAQAMLWRLRGRKHDVLTGLALLDTGRRCVLTQLASTTVRMRPYSRAEVTAYVATGDPMDKAGAYAIQHPTFSPVESLKNCYANVVGLPLCHLVRGLRRLGVAVPRDPLQACPYAVKHGGCVWSRGILDEPSETWDHCLPYDAAG